MDISQAASSILRKIGYLLLHLQSTEKTIKVCIQIALPDEQDFFINVLDRLNEKERKKPLGHFLKALRLRADLNSDVDELLERFLNHRNAFVHNLEEVPEWNLKTREGCMAADAFLTKLHNESKEVHLLFLGILNAWKIQTENETSAEEEACVAKLSKYQSPIIKRKYRNFQSDC